MPRKRLPFYQSRAWKRLRKACIKRDRFLCIRCHKHFPYGTELTAHHVVSRGDGGGNYIENLVSLCTSCHDLVEGEGFKTKFEIVHSVPKSEMEPTVIREFLPAEEARDWREIDWRIRVYGGVKNFVKAREIMAELQAEKAKSWQF